MEIFLQPFRTWSLLRSGGQIVLLPWTAREMREAVGSTAGG